MVTSWNCLNPYETDLTNGSLTIRADTTPEKGGNGQGFRPHELLEAALAGCVNIHLRMYAANHAIELNNLRVTVSVDRTNDTTIIFNYSVEVSGNLNERQRAKLLQIAETCPVRRTISKEIGFEVIQSD